MSETNVLVRIDKPHFTISLYEKALIIDVKGKLKDEIKETLENKPVLRETLGRILGMFAPLHVRLNDIDSVNMDKIGTVKIHLPHHRDVVITLERKEAKRLVDKLNQLIPEAKENELERIIKEHKLQRIAEEKQLMEKEEEIMPVGGAQFPIPGPKGAREKIKEAEKIIEEKQK